MLLGEWCRGGSGTGAPAVFLVEVVGPVVVEVAVGTQGSQLEDGFGAGEPPQRAPVMSMRAVASVLMRSIWWRLPSTRASAIRLRLAFSPLDRRPLRLHCRRPPRRTKMGFGLAELGFAWCLKPVFETDARGSPGTANCCHVHASQRR